jgi:hypothetical protein
MRRHPDVPFWLCVGDIADPEGRYEAFDRPVYWIKGNNENFDAIASAAQTSILAAHKGPSEGTGQRGLPANLHYIPNGRLVAISVSSASVGQPFTDCQGAGCLRIAGLGGTFAPTWYDTAAADLPHPIKRTTKATEAADKRRHFVREEVDACKAMRGVDVFLSHEAPRPFRIGRMDAGKTAINDVLAAMKPRLHLFGHHHRFSDQMIQGVRSVGLDLVSRSYALLDPITLDLQTFSL